MNFTVTPCSTPSYLEAASSRWKRPMEDSKKVRLFCIGKSSGQWRRMANTCSTTSDLAGTCTFTWACTVNFARAKCHFRKPRGALRLRFSSRHHWFELRGPTACEVLTVEERNKILARIGPDPLRDDADSAGAIKRILTSRAPIGALLMDQAVISGIGNIYRAELLYRARLNPFRAGSSIPKRALTKLWKDAELLMKAGMIDRRIVTTRPADRPHANGKARRGRNSLRVQTAPASLLHLRHGNQSAGVYRKKALLVFRSASLRCEASD